MKLIPKERAIVVEALHEKAANLSGFLGKVGTMRGAKAVVKLKNRIQQIRDLADSFESDR